MLFRSATTRLSAEHFQYKFYDSAPVVDEKVMTKRHVLANEISDWLSERRKGYNASLKGTQLREQLDLINDAFYQLETSTHFPLDENGDYAVNDIRHPKNPHHGRTLKQLRAYAKKNKIVTSYTTVEFIDPEAFANMLLHTHCVSLDSKRNEIHQQLLNMSKGKDKAIAKFSAAALKRMVE